MPREIKENWEAGADSFQDDVDMSVGVNWGWDGVNDADLLGDVDGADLLELGCGGGQCTVALAERGADVVGVDFSRNQLAHARRLAAERGADVDLVQADVTDLGMFPAERFDVAFNTWVFQWVDDLAACFEEAYRVLRPGGRFVFSMPHPFWRVVDPDTHRVEKSYFETGRWVKYEDVDEEGRDLVVYLHKLSDVYDGLVDAGFDVERMLEPGTADPDDYEPGPWGESPPELRAKLPQVLIVAARKSE